MERKNPQHCWISQRVYNVCMRIVWVSQIYAWTLPGNKIEWETNVSTVEIVLLSHYPS